MIGCLWTRVHKQPISALYFQFESEFKFYNLEAWSGPNKMSHFASFHRRPYYLPKNPEIIFFLSYINTKINVNSEDTVFMDSLSYILAIRLMN